MYEEKLTNENFELYCAKRYDNPQAISTEEFYEDIGRIKYIKKLITRHVKKINQNESNKNCDEGLERLILNHIITLYNCFGIHLAKILFLKLESQFRYVKPFLVLLNVLPKEICNVGKYDKIYTDDISMDVHIVNALRRILNENNYRQ